jgi:hypothetical protein
MEDIAREVFRQEWQARENEIKEMIREAQYKAYAQALQDVMDVIKYDIESITRIGIDGCKDIFEDRKAQQFISDNIIKMVEKKLFSNSFRP